MTDQASEIEFKSFGDGRSDLWSASSLLDSVIDRMEADIDKYTSRTRDYENLRFISLSVFFAIYAIMSLLVLQITIDGDFTSQIALINERISKRFLVGMVLMGCGAFVLTQVFSRYVATRTSLSLIRNHIRHRIEFADNILARISTWESNFSGDYYEKSIIRLKIITVGQLSEELRRIVGAERESQ